MPSASAPSATSRISLPSVFRVALIGAAIAFVLSYLWAAAAYSPPPVQYNGVADIVVTSSQSNAQDASAPPTGFTCLHYVVENRGETLIADVKIVITFPVQAGEVVTTQTEHGAKLEKRYLDETKVELAVQKDSKDGVLHPNQRFGVTLVAPRQHWRPSKVELRHNGDPYEFETPDATPDNLFVLNVPPSRHGDLLKFWHFPRFWLVQIVVGIIFGSVYFGSHKVVTRGQVTAGTQPPESGERSDVEIQEAAGLKMRIREMETRLDANAKFYEQHQREADAAVEKAKADAQKVMDYAEGELAKAAMGRAEMLQNFTNERDKIVDETTKYVCEMLCRSGRINFKHSDRLLKILASPQSEEA